MRSAAIAVFLLAYYFFFSWDRVKTHFAEDDMMNMGIYFRLGPGRALASQFLLWKNFYRPMGAAFYMPLHHWFGLNPQPFQTTILILLAVNLFLEYGLARALGCRRLVSALAALIVAYQASLSNLEYNIDMVYDVLCFTFFVGALIYYVRIRGQGRGLGWGELVVFLLLYLCALNSKEMALTFPFVLVAYEWCYRGSRGAALPGCGPAFQRVPPGGSPAAGQKVWPHNLAVILVFALCLLSFYGKSFGAGAMVRNPAYQPVFTLERFMSFQKAALRDLFGSFGTPGWRGVVGILALVTYLAWRRRRPVLRFLWVYMLLTPVPIAFLNGRTQGALYIPLAGWAIFAAVVFVDIAEALANFLVQEPLFRRLGQRLG